MLFRSEVLVLFLSCDCRRGPRSGRQGAVGNVRSSWSGVPRVDDPEAVEAGEAVEAQRLDRSRIDVRQFEVGHLAQRHPASHLPVATGIGRDAVWRDEFYRGPDIDVGEQLPSNFRKTRSETHVERPELITSCGRRRVTRQRCFQA